MRRAPAPFPRALHAPPARAATPSGRGAEMAPRWLREPFGIGAHPRAHPRRAPCPLAPPFAPFVAALSRAFPRRSARRFSRPPCLARAPPRALHGPGFPLGRARALPAQQAGLDAGAAASSRAPFAFAPARHSRSHSACRFAGHIARRFSLPRDGARDTAHAREDRAANGSTGPPHLAPAFPSPRAGSCAVRHGRAWRRERSRAQQASLDARALHRARLQLSDAGEGSTGPAGEPGRARAAPGPLHVSDARAAPRAQQGRLDVPTGPGCACPTCARFTGPAGELGRASAPPSPLHLSAVRALHGPGRRAWTCEGSTGPGCTCPTRARAPRAQQATLDARGLHRARCTCPTRARSTGPAGPPGRARAPPSPPHLSDVRALHGPGRRAWTREGSTEPAARVRRAPALHGPSRPAWTREGSTGPGCICPTRREGSRARQARMDARALHRARLHLSDVGEGSTGPAGEPGRARAPPPPSPLHVSNAREGSTGPAGPPGLAHRARLHLSDARASGPAGKLGRASAPPSPLHLSDARALHGPSRPAWTREGFTEPAAPVRRARGLHGPSRRAWTPEGCTGPGCTCPTRPHAPRAQQARLDVPTAPGCTCPTHARSTGPAGPPRSVHRARCTCPTCASAPRAQRARLDARAACQTREGLHVPRFTCPTRAGLSDAREPPRASAHRSSQ